ncbi:Uncharacterised protein [Bordetella pertussis]|nr:Uncharacterised protein [Bordetella pertussis]
MRRSSRLLLRLESSLHAITEYNRVMTDNTSATPPGTVPAGRRCWCLTRPRLA